MRTEFFIAKRYLFAKKSTNAITWISWISVIGVTIGTAALFLILSVFNGFEELNLIYAKKLSPDLKITPRLGLKFNKNSLDTNLFQSPAINYYVNVLEDNVLLKYNNSQYFATLRGVSQQYLKSKEITCLVATHDSTDSLSFADETIVLNNGKIVVKEKSINLYNHPTNKYLASLFADVNEIKLSQLIEMEGPEETLLLYPHQLKIVEYGKLKVKIQKSYFKGSHYLILAEANET